MYMGLGLAEDSALRGLLEETTDDIVLRLDSDGFIKSASANLADISYDLSQLLLKPHVADLAERDFSPLLQAYSARILDHGNRDGGPADRSADGAADWLEFRVLAIHSGDRAAEPSDGCWYALSLRALTDGNGAVTGALGLLRSVQRVRGLEGEIHSRALVDPLTGLANRHAFCAALRRQLASGQGGAIALFEIDRMRAVFMQYGQRTADEIVWGFARFLEAMAHGSHELAQLDGERFCVILPGLSRQAAREWVQDVLGTFASLTLTASARSPQLSASAGLAVIECTVDWTLRQAELALVMARARGGMQMAENSHFGAPVPRVALA